MYCLVATKEDKYFVTSYRNVRRKKDLLFVIYKGYEFQVMTIFRYGNYYYYYYFDDHNHYLSHM